jgi:hypothetical protein
LEISSLRIEHGKYFGESDSEEKAKYAVIGNGACLDFF